MTPERPLPRILIVDDEESVLNAMKRLFLDEPCEILTARSGEEGLDLLAARQPVQVVISDFRMPGMNGISFLHAVNMRWPDAVRIVLSGYTDIGAVIEAINDGGIYKFIPKPWNDDEVKIAVANALERHRLYRQNAELTRQLQQSNEELQTLNTILQERITDEVISLRTQNESLAQCQDILMLLPAAVVRLDHDGWITYYNSRMTKLFGWTDANMLYSPRDRVFSSEMNGLVDRVVREGSAACPIAINGRMNLVRGVRTMTSSDTSGVILVFDEHMENVPRRFS